MSLSATTANVWFDPAGVGQGTGTAEEADPIETHVYLATSENDETTQEVLASPSGLVFCKRSVERTPKQS